MKDESNDDKFAGLEGVIRPPEEERPRRIEDFFQGADAPALSVLAHRMAAEDYGDNLLMAGPSGTGKNTAMRIYGARRCCGNVVQGELNPCGQCSLCETIFAGKPISGVGYNEFSTTDRDWRHRFEELVVVANGPVTVPGGNRRSLPPVIALDELHVLDVRLQTHICTLIQNSVGCFLFASSEPDKLIDPLKSRCMTLEFNPPTRAKFIAAFASLLSSRGITFDPQVPDLFFQASSGNVRECVGRAHALSSKKLARWSERAVREHLGLPLYTPVGWY